MGCAYLCRIFPYYKIIFKITIIFLPIIPCSPIKPNGAITLENFIFDDIQGAEEGVEAGSGGSVRVSQFYIKKFI